MKKDVYIAISFSEYKKRYIMYKYTVQMHFAIKKQSVESLRHCAFHSPPLTYPF